MYMIFSTVSVPLNRDRHCSYLIYKQKSKYNNARFIMERNDRLSWLPHDKDLKEHTLRLKTIIVRNDVPCYYFK